MILHVAVENISSNQLITSMAKSSVFGEKKPGTAAHIVHVLLFRISVFN
jgi:hypothetical protein